jgi:hypothetical protein
MVLKSITDIRRSNWVAGMLLWLFVGYIGSISLFTHSHTIDGNIIYHSHFYAGTADNPNHSHSSQQCKVISALSLYTALAAAAAIVVMTPRHCLKEVLKDKAESLTNHLSSHKSLRAPPAFI